MVGQQLQICRQTVLPLLQKTMKVALLGITALAAVLGALGASPPPAGGDGWTTVVSKGRYGNYDCGAESFAKAMEASPVNIIRRDCPSCSADLPSRTIFYKRLTGLPSYDLLSVLKSNWTLAPGNAFNVDFELYSALDDALSGDSSKRWAYCNGDDPSGVGAFRDCSPSTEVRNANQWNSFSGRGGQADILFAVANTAKP